MTPAEEVASYYIGFLSDLVGVVFVSLGLRFVVFGVLPLMKLFLFDLAEGECLIWQEMFIASRRFFGLFLILFIFLLFTWIDIPMFDSMLIERVNLWVIN